MQFKPGDRVRCIKPKSTEDSEFDLDPRKIYTILEVCDNIIRIEDNPRGYLKERFILEED